MSTEEENEWWAVVGVLLFGLLYLNIVERDFLA